MNLILNLIRKNIYLYIIFIYIYKKYTAFFYFLEINNYKFLSSKKIGTVLDIGSNKFQTAKIFLKINKDLKVICFDPQISINKFSKNIVFYNYALSNNQKKQFFFIPYYKNFILDSLSSFQKKNIYNYFKKYSLNMGKIFFLKKIIKKKILDKMNINCQFIKIDVEGSEMDVLKGSKLSIKKNNPIIFIEKNKNLREIKKFLKKFNYKSYNNYDSRNNIFNNIRMNSDNIFFLNEHSFKYLQ